MYYKIQKKYTVKFIMRVEVKCDCAYSAARLCPTLCAPWTVATRFLCPQDFPGKNTGVGCHFLLQGMIPTQGLNPCLLHLQHWQADCLPLSHLGSPKCKISTAQRQKRSEIYCKHIHEDFYGNESQDHTNYKLCGSY